MFRVCSRTKMRIDILTGFTTLFEGPLTESMIRRAREAGLVEIHLHDLRDYTDDRHRTIDDSPYGGGAGMILKPEPIFACVEGLMAERSYEQVIVTTPRGEPFTQNRAKKLSLLNNIMFICGHYKGIDQRVHDALATMELSIGDYVLTGGELAAMVVVDAVSRLLPGVLGDAESLLSDSFMENSLDCPYYTRPPEYRGMTVPDELVSGDHEAVARWRSKVAEELTAEKRPDLLD